MKRFTPTQLGHTPYLFFTGKGGVGKTSTAAATAIALADAGKRVLIVSTDPASNLQDVFGVELSNAPAPVPNVANLDAANLDPEEAAQAYRDRVIGPYRDKLPKPAVDQMEEQMSGACTVEVAAFDEFTQLLTDNTHTDRYDHIVFDTAPTGHTLRLLQLPSAWSDFLDENEHGASCLGPVSGLKAKKESYEQAVKALADSSQTTLVLVARPDEATIQEANRASKELGDLGILNQQLIINGVFERNSDDPTAIALENKQRKVLDTIDDQASYIPLVGYTITGLDALRAFGENTDVPRALEAVDLPAIPGVQELVHHVSQKSEGVIMTMGKGGVGKTTMACAIAVGLAEKGHRVHLTTTDPTAHVGNLVQDHEFLQVSRIDPKEEVEAYKARVLQTAGESLSEDELAFMKEDLDSPCTEEIAVFQAFAKVVDDVQDSFVVIDTAPTGHTLLLLDAAQSYHREVERAAGNLDRSVKELLPKLRDPAFTTVALVTLPEATPVFEASRLQEDLKRASIVPSWWIINQSFGATETRDPLLQNRALAEQQWIKRVVEKEATNAAIVPWQADAIVGIDQLKVLLEV
ncbi:arsenical pump-driving ATPase [Paenalkalicoccus suaedae]|uniref:Arsenical pump-driving ATPase n=1 Tax=Paenalkalicoccus suaedae TaxID=2592382 RepID=A0A859FAX6_9BACI|nr:arsenical pump-driving ATPase [Paenalkalicoccus suaedae]QKS70503.1 arsenical pump-driving ATPase [Paenalkalicoccus suaedae]